MNCRAEEKQYIVNDEFTTIALSLIEKYTEVFHSINIKTICCVNLTTTEKSHTKMLWQLQKVKMPMALHCQYDWYVIFRSADWDDWNTKEKMVRVSEVLVCLPNYPPTNNTSLPNITTYV